MLIGKDISLHVLLRWSVFCGWVVEILFIGQCREKESEGDKDAASFEGDAEFLLLPQITSLFQKRDGNFSKLKLFNLTK